MKLWIVLLREHVVRPYGPFTSQSDAEAFAEFLNAEVDKAEVVRLQSPLHELLAWRDTRTVPSVRGEPPRTETR